MSVLSYGPEPGLVLPREKAQELVSKVALELTSNQRKIRAFNRFQVYKEDYQALVHNKISTWFSDKTTKRELYGFVDVSLNPALDITRGVCKVWKHGAHRIVRDVPDTQLEGFQDFINDSWLDIHIPEWNKLAFLLGPLTAVPVMRDGNPVWDVLLPHYYDVIANPADPFGAPLAAAWTLSEESSLLGQEQDTEADTVLLDAQAWHYYKTDRHTPPKLIKSIPHGLGVFPGETLRFEVSYDSDWWGCDRNQRLVSGTVTISTIIAMMLYVRKAQNRKLLAFKGMLDEAARGQKLDPEVGVRVDTDDPGSVVIETFDLDTPPDQFIKTAQWIYQMLASSFGGSVDIGGQTATPVSSPEFNVSFSHESLTEIRNSQIPFARRFEKNLLAKAMGMAKRMGYNGTNPLPDMDAVKKGFSVQYPRLARSFSDPKKEADFTDWQLSKGTITYEDILRRDNPTLTNEQLRKLHEENLESQSRANDFFAKRDMIKERGEGDTEFQTAAQRFGAAGGSIKNMAPGKDNARNPKKAGKRQTTNKREDRKAGAE